MQNIEICVGQAHPDRKVSPRASRLVALGGRGLRNRVEQHDESKGKTDTCPDAPVEKSPLIAAAGQMGHEVTGVAGRWCEVKV